jgi:hypothetical protein
MEPLRPWLRRTHRLAKHLRRIHRAMDKIEDSYAPMRDEYHQDENKEAIDRAFSELMSARQALCNPPMNGASEYLSANMAGGSRYRGRRTTRRHKRRHH